MQHSIRLLGSSTQLQAIPFLWHLEHLDLHGLCQYEYFPPERPYLWNEAGPLEVPALKSPSLPCSPPFPNLRLESEVAGSGYTLRTFFCTFAMGWLRSWVVGVPTLPVVAR